MPAIPDHLTHAVLDALHPRLGQGVALATLETHMTQVLAQQGLQVPSTTLTQACQHALAGIPTPVEAPLLPARPGVDWAGVPLDPEARAAAVLQACHWRPPRTTRWGWRWEGWRPPARHWPVRLVKIYEMLGIEERSRFIAPAVASFLRATPDRPAEVVLDRDFEANSTVQDDRAILAHMLGHLVLGHATCHCRLQPQLPPSGQREVAPWDPRPDRPQIAPIHRLAEEAADRFAAALLLPTVCLRKDHRAAPARIARWYGVPEAMVRYRLATLTL